jgi:two-component system response regulator QseB
VNIAHPAAATACRMPRTPPDEDKVLRVNGLRLDPRARHVSGAAGPVDVCPVEFELLRALMARPGVALSPAQLAGWLRSCGRMTRRDAVPVHIHHLRRKIGGDHIRTIRGLGYLMPRDRQHW